MFKNLHAYVCVIFVKFWCVINKFFKLLFLWLCSTHLTHPSFCQESFLSCNLKYQLMRVAFTVAELIFLLFGWRSDRLRVFIFCTYGRTDHTIAPVPSFYFFPQPAASPINFISLLAPLSISVIASRSIRHRLYRIWLVILFIRWQPNEFVSNWLTSGRTDRTLTVWPFVCIYTQHSIQHQISILKFEKFTPSTFTLCTYQVLPFVLFKIALTPC